jgi:hypothetical protein
MQSIPQMFPPSPEPTAFPVWHASIQSISGVVVRLGGVTYFSPMDDPSCYVITDTAQLIVTMEIGEPIASFVRTEICSKLARHPKGSVVMEGVAR